MLVFGHKIMNYVNKIINTIIWKGKKFHIFMICEIIENPFRLLMI